jgi:hypothetical protein
MIEGCLVFYKTRLFFPVSVLCLCGGVCLNWMYEWGKPLIKLNTNVLSSLGKVKTKQEWNPKGYFIACQYTQ